MTTMATLMRNASIALTLTREQATLAHKAEALSRVVRILDDACSEPQKYVRIVRSQIGQGGRTLFTYNQINHRALEGDLDACEVMQEYIRQERLDGVPETVTDEQINVLWQEGISLGRILSANPFKLANYYTGRGREGAKPYVSLGHISKALLWASENHAEMESGLFDLMVNFKTKFLKDERDVVDVFVSLDESCEKYLTVA